MNSRSPAATPMRHQHANQQPRQGGPVPHLHQPAHIQQQANASIAQQFGPATNPIAQRTYQLDNSHQPMMGRQGPSGLDPNTFAPVVQPRRMSVGEFYQEGVHAQATRMERPSNPHYGPQPQEVARYTHGRDFGVERNPAHVTPPAMNMHPSRVGRYTPPTIEVAPPAAPMQRPVRRGAPPPQQVPVNRRHLMAHSAPPPVPR